MKEKLTFWQLYKRVIEKLDEKRLGEALCILQNLVNVIGDWQLLDEVSNVKSSYELLLYYMSQNTKDPAREQQRTNFIAQCYNIADKAAQLERYKKSPSQAFVNPLKSILKDLENQGLKSITSDFNNEDTNIQVALYTELFNASYYADLWNKEDILHAQEIIDSALISDNEKSLMISGLFINSLQIFDTNKLHFFIDNYSNTVSENVRIRIIVAITFVLFKYNNRLFAYPQTTKKVKQLCKDPLFINDIQILQKLIIESLSTHEINRKMREEIIPSMLKNHNFNPEKFGIKSIDEIIESNPEWKDFEQQVGKLAEWEASGADIYYSTFSALKHYSFFNNQANWFYPFNENHPDIPEQIRKIGLKGIAKALLDSEVLCDSDKYSFCMLTSQMTNDQVNMIVSQLPEMEGHTIKIKETTEATCRNYLRNLFRYFNLYNSGLKPENPFKEEMSFLNCELLSNAFKNQTEIDKISAFALKKEKYDIAIQFLLLNEKYGNTDAETYQKLGFCYQKKKLFFEAVHAYEKAYAIKEDSIWTLQHLAQANRILGRYKESYNYYKILETKNTENAKTAFRCGECLVHMEQYEEAIHEFFKAEYISDNPTAAMRAIAWCSILTNNIEQARKYYDKLLSTQKSGNDLINAGHAAWIDNDIKAAIGYYKQAYSILKRDEFIRNIEADKETLKSQGISTNSIMLMTDLILLENEQK